jgi:hypothetical protein
MLSSDLLAEPDFHKAFINREIEVAGSGRQVGIE